MAKPKPINYTKKARTKVSSIYGPTLRFYEAEIARIKAEYATRAENRRKQYADMAKYYTGTVPSLIGNMYNTAASNQGAFAKGFSDGLQISQNQWAANTNQTLGNIGAPESQMANPGTGAADTMYAMGGFFPAIQLGQQGAAFGSAAALQGPAFIARGEQLARDIEKESLTSLSPLFQAMAQLKSERNAQILTISEQMRDNSVKLAAARRDEKRKVKAAAEARLLQLLAAGVIDKKEFARRMKALDKNLNIDLSDPPTQPGNLQIKTIPGTGKQYAWDPKKNIAYYVGTNRPIDPKTLISWMRKSTDDNVKIDNQELALLNADIADAMRGTERRVEAKGGVDVVVEEYERPLTFAEAMEEAKTWDIKGDPITIAILIEARLMQEYGVMKKKDGTYVYTRSGLNRIASKAFGKRARVEVMTVIARELGLPQNSGLSLEKLKNFIILRQRGISVEQALKRLRPKPPTTTPTPEEEEPSSGPPRSGVRPPRYRVR